MSTINHQTAFDIAMAYREIETAEKLLADVEKAAAPSHEREDMRDGFGRRVDGLQLGVPSGGNGHRLFNVPWVLAKPIIQAHIATKRTEVVLLSEKARAELDGAAG